MQIVTSRESDVLMLIRRYGPLSRQELHYHMQMRPNTVGDLAARMLRRGLLRERESHSIGRGRPQRPLEIDPDHSRIVGMAFQPGRVSACTLNLHGRRLGAVQERFTRSARAVVASACEVLEAIGTDHTLGIGISTTGFVDPQTRCILTSSATQKQSPTSLEPIYAAAGKCPVLVENDMHAQGAYWLLSRDGGGDEDILLIELRDGAIGAALLIGGRPNRGCIVGGNEIGHTRFPVETERCYCGQYGCLERICSSSFLRRITGATRGDLYQHLRIAGPGDPAVLQIMGHLASGIANAINLIRPNRVVLTGQLTECLTFANHLAQDVRGRLLAPLIDRVRIDMWDRPTVSFAEAGAWLVLAAIYHGSRNEPGAWAGGHATGADQSTATVTSSPTAAGHSHRASLGSPHALRRHCRRPSHRPGRSGPRSA